MMNRISKLIPITMVVVGLICAPLSMYYLYPVLRWEESWKAYRSVAFVLKYKLIPSLFFLGIVILAVRVYRIFKKEPMQERTSNLVSKIMIVVITICALSFAYFWWELSGYEMTQFNNGSIGLSYSWPLREYQVEEIRIFKYIALYIGIVALGTYVFLRFRKKEQLMLEADPTIARKAGDVTIKHRIVEQLILLGFGIATISVFLPWGASRDYDHAHWLDDFFRSLAVVFSKIRMEFPNEHPRISTGGLSGFDVSFWGYAVFACAILGISATRLPYFRLYSNTAKFATIRIAFSVIGLLALITMRLDTRFGWKSVFNDSRGYSLGPLVAIIGFSIAGIASLLATAIVIRSRNPLEERSSSYLETSKAESTDAQAEPIPTVLCKGCGESLKAFQVKNQLGNPKYNEWAREGYCSYACFQKNYKGGQ